MMTCIMRRSKHVAAPLLACAAAGLLAGCSLAGECPPSKHDTHCSATVKPFSETVFGGFGKSFSENADILWFLLAAGGIILVGRALGE
jgi:hypothetical protein